MPLYFSPDQLAHIKVALDTSLQAGNYQTLNQGVPNWATPLCKTIMVKKEIVTLPWVRDAGFLRQVRRGQAPHYETLQGSAQVSQLNWYESSIELDMVSAEEDDTGQLMDMARKIGIDYSVLDKILLTDILNNGDTAAYPTYDGQDFFSNAHPKGGTTFSNLTAGDLSPTTLQAVRTLMRQYPSDYLPQAGGVGGNRYIPIVPTLLITPVSLEIVARELVFNTLKPVADFHTENQLKGVIDTVSEPMLTGQFSWFVTAALPEVKPFYRIKHEMFSPFKINEEVSPESPSVRDLMKYRWWGADFGSARSRPPVVDGEGSKRIMIATNPALKLKTADEVKPLPNENETWRYLFNLMKINVFGEMRRAKRPRRHEAEDLELQEYFFALYHELNGHWYITSNWVRPAIIGVYEATRVKQEKVRGTGKRVVNDGLGKGGKGLANDKGNYSANPDTGKIYIGLVCPKFARPPKIDRKKREIYQYE